jgi:hypothetical protein
VNLLAEYQAMPTQITGSFEKILTESFASNYYINIQGLGNKIRTNKQGRAFVFIVLFSTSHFIIH